MIFFLLHERAAAPILRNGADSGLPPMLIAPFSDRMYSTLQEALFARSRLPMPIRYVILVVQAIIGVDTVGTQEDFLGFGTLIRNAPILNVIYEGSIYRFAEALMPETVAAAERLLPTPFYVPPDEE